MASSLFCRYAESHYGQGATLVGVGVETLDLPSFPYDAELWVAVCFTAHYEELGTKTIHALSYKVFAPDLGERDTDTMRFRLEEPAGPRHHPGWDAHHIEPLHIILEVEEPGPHTITVLIDGQPPGKSLVVYFAQESTDQ